MELLAGFYSLEELANALRAVDLLSSERIWNDPDETYLTVLYYLPDTIVIGGRKNNALVRVIIDKDNTINTVRFECVIGELYKFFARERVRIVAKKEFYSRGLASLEKDAAILIKHLFGVEIFQK